MTGVPSFDWFGSSASVDVTARIQDLNDVAFEDIVADQRYELIDLDLSGSLAFGGVDQDFTSEITLSSVIDSTGAAGRIQEFISQAQFNFTLDLLDTGLDAETEARLEGALVSLATMGTEQIVQFLKDIGETVTGALRDSAFDIALPLTDVRLGNLMTELSSFFTNLASTFTIDKGALGFSIDSGGSTSTVDTSLTQETDTQNGFGLNLAQFTKLLDYQSFSITVFDNGSTHDLTVTLAGTDVHDTGLSLSARMAALADLLNTALSGHGIAVSVGSLGGLSLNSVKPSGGGTPSFPSFTIRSGVKTDNSEDNSFSLFDLGFNLTNLSAIDAVSNYGLSLFGDDAGTSENDGSLFSLSALDLSLFSSLSALDFNVSVDGVSDTLSVTAEPGGGWATLGDLVTAFNSALSAKGWGITIGQNGDGGGLTFAVDSGEARDFGFSLGDGAGFSFIDLGFDAFDLTQLGSTADYVMRFVDAATSFDLGALDLSALSGVKNLRFSFTVDGRDTTVDVEDSSGTGWGSLGDLIADFNLALSAKGFGINVGTNSGGDGLSFNLGSGESRSFSISADPSDLLRSLDIEGLMGWVNSELSSVVAGAGLELTEDGELLFSFPDLEASLSIDSDDGIGFNTSDLGLGVLGDLELSAQLSAQFNAVFESAVGIDLVGFGSTIIGGSDNALEGKQNFSGKLKDAILDNVFFNDLNLSASVHASATEITGSADVGIVSVAIGADDASANFVHVDAQLEANILGSNLDDGFNEQLTFRNLRDAVADRVEFINGEVVVVPAKGIASPSRAI